jgi:osmoprotectant transport system substrate-binding protein
MILSSNVVPLVNKSIQGTVADVINAVQAKLTPEALVDMNVQNTTNQQSPADIAKKFLADNGLK